VSALGFALLLAATPPPATPAQFAFQIVQQRIIIRVPTRRPPRPAARRTRPGFTWRETATADCFSASDIAQARFTRPGIVDMLLRDRRLVRARLDSECVALGYYSAFYLVPGEDGRICVDRDSIVSRGGSECAISGFNLLERRPVN
jgi:hypothetical protein